MVSMSINVGYRENQSGLSCSYLYYKITGIRVPL